MAGTFQVSGDNVTVAFSYTAPIAQAQPAVFDCAHLLYRQVDGVSFDDLTTQEKLDVVDKHVKQVILDAAKSYRSNTAQDLARATAAELSEDAVDLG